MVHLISLLTGVCKPFGIIISTNPPSLSMLISNSDIYFNNNLSSNSYWCFLPKISAPLVTAVAGSLLERSSLWLNIFDIDYWISTSLEVPPINTISSI